MRIRANTVLISVLTFYVIACALIWFIFDEGRRATAQILVVALCVGCVYKGLRYAQQALSLVCAFEALRALALINRLEAPAWMTFVVALFGLASMVASIVVFKSTEIKELATMTSRGGSKRHET